MNLNKMFKTKVINSQNSSLPNYFTIIYALEVIYICNDGNIMYNLIYFSPQPWKEIEAQRSEAAIQSHQEELGLGF